MKKIHLWPAYIDAQKTREQGRKVPLGLAISNPTIEEILQACKTMGLDPEREEKGYPPEQGKDERKPGCVLIEKKHPKSKILKMVCDNIRKTRQ